MCAQCHSFDIEWAKASGKGSIYSYTVAYRAAHPGFQHDAPYGIVIVELKEGPRLISRMVDTRPGELKIGMPVEVVFEDVTPEVTLPMFRRSQETRH